MRTLRRGSRGTDVQELQVLLQRLGYNPGPVDGIFGARTEQAVIQFQRNNGLVHKFTGAEDSAILAFARTHGMNIIPLISNNFSSELISTVHNDPVRRQNHTIIL
ncbi:peptidoglycan-binding domain-containing protein [Paradesulfitobacterium aromaticivorans]